MLAPVTLFVYNRPWHTQQTLEALKNNDLANESDLIIFSDAPKNDNDWLKVQEVRDYIETVNGFKSVRIIEREKNLGLAKSIIYGVTEVVNHYGKIIVVEDDIVTSPAFLQFMNRALDYYEDQNRVWHISGWNYPIDSSGLPEIFFWRVMNCWGWATWADRWKFFQKNPNKLIKQWKNKQKQHFDLDNSGVFWPQVTANAKGKMNTWAIFWYATIYQNQGLCINPTMSYISNIGQDGSGVHYGDVGENMLVILNKNPKVVLSDQITENQIAVERIKKYYHSQRRPIKVRIINKLSRFFLKKNLIK